VLLTYIEHLSNTVTHLYCDNNQITSFQHLVNSVNTLKCNNNRITNIKDLLYIPSMFKCDINITPNDIYKNRVKYGLNKINKIYKNKQNTKI